MLMQRSAAFDKNALDAQEEFGNGAQAAHTGSTQDSKRILLGSADWSLKQVQTDPEGVVVVEVGCKAG
jgi:hypothetical protein